MGSNALMARIAVDLPMKFAFYSNRTLFPDKLTVNICKTDDYLGGGLGNGDRRNHHLCPSQKYGGNHPQARGDRDFLS